MTDPGLPPGPDAHYLGWTARLYGWQISAHSDGSVRMSLPDRTVWVYFGADGRFRYGTVAGSGCLDERVDLLQVLDTLEAYGTPRPPAPRRRPSPP